MVFSRIARTRRQGPLRTAAGAETADPRDKRLIAASGLSSASQARLAEVLCDGAAVGPRGEPDGLVNLTCECRLIGVAAFLGDDADGHLCSPQPIAREFDPRTRQVLSGGKPEQGADALIELECRKPRSGREIRNPQWRIEMAMNMAEHGRQRGHFRLRAARRVAGDAR